MGRHLDTVALAAMLAMAASPAPAQDAPRPNIVAIMVDDAPPFDFSAYHRGLGAVETPNIDRIAREGLMISDYYAQPSCTAGRAAFITGQYPIRTGLTSVGQPGAPVGLQAEDPTIATMLKAEGYATAQFGKSHLGDRNEFLPTVHGFDEFYGFLYHLNMMEMPEQPEFPADPNFPGRPRNVVHALASDVDDATVDPRWGRVGRQTVTDEGALGATRMETFDEEVLDRALTFVRTQAAADTPFFLWFNPSRMHQTTHVGPQWRGRSGHSAYADGLIQLDALVGGLLDELDTLGIADDTIVLFTSDNGVNLSHWPDAGAASFRGEKGLTWDGGFRVPMLVRWPGRIPAGEWTGEFMTSEDWAPTLLAAAGVQGIKEALLAGTEIGGRTYKVHLDGFDQLAMLTGDAPSARHAFFFYAETELMAGRVDQWKLHVAIKNAWLEAAEKLPGGLIVDIKLDPFERTPEAPGHFAWMKEKTWILPILAPYVNEHLASLRAFPPRQAGSGVGAAALATHVNETGPSD